MSEEPPLPPLSKRRQLKIARFRVRMSREEIKKDLQDIERLREHISSALERLGRSVEAAMDAQSELDNLTGSKK